MCTPFTDTVCGTPYSKKACNTVTEEKCEVVYDTQLEEECRDTQQTLCRDIVRQECSVVQEDECETRYESVESEECREEKDCRDLHDSLRALPAAVLEYYLPRSVQYYSVPV